MVFFCPQGRNQITTDSQQETPDRAMQTAGIFVQAAVRRLAYNDDELRCPDVQRHHSSHIVRLQQLL